MVFFSETGKDISKSDMILKGKCDEENVDDVSHEEELHSKYSWSN